MTDAAPVFRPPLKRRKQADRDKPIQGALVRVGAERRLMGGKPILEVHPFWKLALALLQEVVRIPRQSRRVAGPIGVGGLTDQVSDIRFRANSEAVSHKVS